MRAPCLLLLAACLCTSHAAQLDVEGALLLAAAAGRAEAARYALDQGAQVDARDGSAERRPALVIATAAGHAHVVDLLLERGADAGAATVSGITPLMFAAHGDRAAIAARLLDAGASPEDRDRRLGNTALHVAARRGALDTLKLLLARGAQVNAASTGDGRTPLMLAAREPAGLEAVIELLLHGADPNLRAHDGSTALMGAAVWGHGHIIATLLANGARPGDVSADGRSALHRAATTGRVEVMSQLIDAGAPLEPRAADGNTPLGAAVFFGRAEAVDRLLAGGAHVDTPARNGETPLMLSVRGNHPELAAELIARGADVNATAGEDAVTPLLLAAERGLGALVRLLLRAGADPRQSTADGRTPLAAAVAIGDEGTSTLLRQGGAIR